MLGVLSDKDLLYDVDYNKVETSEFPNFIISYQDFDRDKSINQNLYNSEINKILIEQWSSKLRHLQLEDDEYFFEENIEKPNEWVVNFTYQFLIGLSQLNIFPDKLSSSVEEGICLKFKNKGKALYLEIYNNGEIGYIIEDLLLKKTIENEDLFSLGEILNKISSFYNNFYKTDDLTLDQIIVKENVFLYSQLNEVS